MQSSPVGTVIVGIIVSYNPHTSDLLRLTETILRQVKHLIIVDNGSREDVLSSLGSQAKFVEFIGLEGNYGIAKAQNIGIERARTLSADYVLLLDQDSMPFPDMVDKLLAAVQEKEGAGVRVAAAGPCYEDPRQRNTNPFVRLNGLTLERQSCETAGAVVDVDFLIASGCLIPTASLDALGVMVEELFIDYVDIEWGLRAQHKGYRSFGVCAARMEHALGDNAITFRNRHIPVHTPLRHYYHVRNAVWLAKLPWISGRWRIVLAWRLVRQVLFFSVMSKPRLQHTRMMFWGLVDGVFNKMGKKV